MDYKTYHFSKKEIGLTLFSGLGIVFLGGWLFYHSLFAMVLAIPFLPYWFRNRKRKKVEGRKRVLRIEFRECLQSVAGALSAGYSMENAWKEAEKDLRRLLGENSYMVREIARMNSQIALNIPIEKLLNDFAARSGLEDVQNFTQVFQFAKRGGGNLNQIIQTTSMHIADKVEVEREIETAMAAKRLEQKIMSVMPLFILFYIGITSPGFIETLYGNLLGIGVMSICLAGYLLAIRAAKKIVSVRV